MIFKIYFGCARSLLLCGLFSSCTEQSVNCKLAQMVESPLAMQETKIRSLSQEDALEKGMATYSSILA